MRYAAGHVNARFAQVVIARLFATGASVVSGLVLLRVLPRLLPGSEWGVVNVALMVLTYLPLLDGGFRLVVNREMLQAADPGSRLQLAAFGQALGTRLLLLAMVAGPLLTVLYSLAPAARAADLPVLFYVGTGVAGAVAFGAGMQVQALVGIDRQIWMSVIQGGGAVMNLVTLLVGFRLGWGVWAFPAAQFLAALGQWSLAVGLLRSQLPGLRLLDLGWDATRSTYWKEHRRGAWSVFRMQVFILLLLSLDLVLAGWFVDALELTAYGLMLRVIGIGRTSLTSLGEALWPRIARGDGDQGQLTRRVLALNAWLFGIAGGVFLGAMPAVLGWYVSDQWVASPLLNALLVMRFVVIGMSSPAAYHLLGAGSYSTLVRALGWEVGVGVVLGGFGGWFWGGVGVAGGFLTATLLGTFYPLFAAYARTQGVTAVGRWFGQIWARAAFAGAASLLAATWVLSVGLQGPQTLWSALAAGMAGMTAAAGWAGVRSLTGTGPWARRLWNAL